MEIHVSAAYAVELRAPDDLKSFKLTVAAASDAADRLAEALAGIATVDGDHAWVRESWIREVSPLSGDPAWQQGVTAMIGYAKKFGWVDEAAGTIRAHIEWAP